MSFIGIFDNLFIFCFEPLYAKALENTVLTLINDNIQSLELRIIMDSFWDKDNKETSLQYQLDFLQA